MSNLRRIIWLASFPKSGNTWMRTLLAHYMMPAGKAPDINNLREFTTGDVRRDFFDAAVGGSYRTTKAEEWIKVRPVAMRLIAASKPDHHFVKTHCAPVKLYGIDVIPPEVTAAAIYIMRNPFDLAPSFARHQSCDIDTAIDRMTNPDMVMGTPEGIYEYLGRWDQHVQRWNTADGLPLYVIRYEDMLNNPAKVMRGLLQKFLKLPIDKPKLAKAIKANSFDALKKQEETLGFTEKPDGMQKFFAKGQSGVWKEDLTPEQVGRIREEFLPTLRRWYPEMLEETRVFAEAGQANDVS